jgi:hypothetical protein
LGVFALGGFTWFLGGTPIKPVFRRLVPVVTILVTDGRLASLAQFDTP